MSKEDYIQSIRVAKSHVLSLNRDDLTTITRTFVGGLIDRNLSIGEARAILKDALDTIEGISNEKEL